MASDSGSELFLIEAWLMLGYTLTANEEFEKAIPNYKLAIYAPKRMLTVKVPFELKDIPYPH